MPDLAIARLARAARRAMSQFATAGSATTAAILMWLTAQAAGETASPAGALANAADKTDGAPPAASPPDTHAGKSNADADAAAAGSENGTRSPAAGTTADGADRSDAHSESATNGRANGGDHDGGHASVGSSTNPSLLFPD